MQRETLTVSEFSAIVRTHKRAVYRMLRRGEVHGFRVGKLWRIPVSELDRLLTRAE